MPKENIVERHYSKVEGLVRRTASEPSPYEGTFEAIRIHQPTLTPRLISSAHGALREIMFTIPKYAVTSPAEGRPNPLARIYRDLLMKLPPSCRFTIMTHESVADEVSQWISAANSHPDVDLVLAPDDLHFSVWAEDAYVVVQDEKSNDRYLLKPYEFPRYADGLIADRVSDKTPLRTSSAPLYFQGGNLLIGDRFFFIGTDYPTKSRGYVNRAILPNPGETSNDAVYRLYKEYLDSQRELIYVGSRIPVPSQTSRSIRINGKDWTEVLHSGNHKETVQPLFHIDMFMTLAGRNDEGIYQVLVGDPSKAAQALNIPLWPHSLQEVFDDIARQLEQAGFRVIRNPLPLAHLDDPQSCKRTWYFATANNALVQLDDAGDKHVWLPSYGHGGWESLAETDRQNRAIWEGLGFGVTMLGDFHPLAENLGAVHCIKKYLNRGGSHG